MKAIVPLLGWALFLSCIVRFVGQYGTRWEFGRYCMPKTVIGPDGLHYLDGVEIPPFVLSLIEADKEEEMLLVLWGGAGIALLLLAVFLVSTYRKQKRAAEECLQILEARSCNCQEPGVYEHDAGSDSAYTA